MSFLIHPLAITTVLVYYGTNHKLPQQLHHPKERSLISGKPRRTYANPVIFGEIMTDENSGVVRENNTQKEKKNYLLG